MKYNVKQLAYLGVLSALAIIISTVESLMPPIFPMLPYARLGLANCFILFTMVCLGAKESFLVLLLKCVFSAIFSGNPTSALYSLSGGILSFIPMLILVYFQKNSIMAISCLGGILHNLGQILIASAITHSLAPISLLPYMLLLGGICGIITGLISHVIIKRLYGNSDDKARNKDFGKNL